MSFELPAPPEYTFPSNPSDPELWHKAMEYADAVGARHAALIAVGWSGGGGYFAGDESTLWQRQANRITLDPAEAASRLGIQLDDGELSPGFTVVRQKGQLIIGYNGPTDNTYFDTMDCMIEWGQELTVREDNASKRERATHLLHRLNIFNN
jgi:hypothetical protein